MTRVLLAGCAEWSHAAGLVPIGWGLRCSGADVLVATQPALAGRIAAGGLPVAAVGRDHRLGQVLRRFDRLRGDRADLDLATDLDDATFPQLLAAYEQLVPWWWRLVNEPMLGDLVALCRRWRPDLVVWEATTFSGAVAAQVSGAAHARFVWSVDLFARLRARFLALRPPGGADPLADWLGAAARRHGSDFREELVAGQATVSQLPAALGGSGVPVRFVPYNGRAVLPDWLRAPPERPRVCVTLGSSRIDRFGAYLVPLADLVAAVADLPVEVVVTVPDSERAALGPLPPHVRAVDFVPLDALLPTCAAVVDHGGPGTVLTAVAHAVPQLVVPAEFDAPVLAGLLADTGAALVLPPAAATPGAVRAAVRRLLTEPGFRTAATGLAERARALPGPQDLATRIRTAA